MLSQMTKPTPFCSSYHMFKNSLSFHTKVTVYYVDGYFCFLQATGRKDHAKNLMHLYLVERKYPRGLWIFGGFLGGERLTEGWC